jgi:hypothetical protein
MRTEGDLRRLDTLVCTAIPFGYGPAAKLIALAREVVGRTRLVFVGTGAALELATRTRGLFDEIVPLRADHPSAAPHVRSAWGVLSLMDREAAVAARRAERPLFVVDSLLWMRREIPEALTGATRYWAQAFPGLVADDYRPRPELVGPILPVSVPARAGRGNGLVVNLGGSAAPDDRARLYASYARCILAAVRAACLPERFGQVSVLGGEATLAALAGAGASDSVRFESLGHEEARERMRRARAVLTVPGLTTTLECFALRTPTWFLPPQNYSQWCTLRALRRAAAASAALHWEDLPSAPSLGERLPAEARDPLVRDAVLRLTADAGVVTQLAERLRGVGVEAAARVDAQSAFYSELGPPGTALIAAALLAYAPEGAPARRATISFAARPPPRTRSLPHGTH